jgi:GNAT superfamily N-acetyltransferase
MASDIRVRAAREEELFALGALKLRASLAWGDHVTELLALPEARELKPEWLPASFVADISGTAVGFATVLVDGHGNAELEELFVDPDWWRHGIGRRLFEEAAGRARAAGANFLRVVGSRHARAFYEAWGFQVFGEVTTQCEPALSMRRRLD